MRCGFLLPEAPVSPVERKLMEADRLKMCGMMWLKEHETCLPMDAVHIATGEAARQLTELLHVTTDFYYLYRYSDGFQGTCRLYFPHM